MRPRCANATRYVTVIGTADTGQVLAMVEHRNAAAVAGFSSNKGHAGAAAVQVVVSDRSKSYKAAIDAHLGHTRPRTGPVPCC